MVVYTGGFSPQDFATDAMRYIATGVPRSGRAERLDHLGHRRRRDRLPADAHHLRPRRSTRIGNRERAAYLSGVNTRRVVLIAFAISGGLSRLRRRPAGRLCLQGRASDGRRLSAALDRRRGAGRHVDPRRARLAISAPLRA